MLYDNTYIAKYQMQGSYSYLENINFIKQL